MASSVGFSLCYQNHHKMWKSERFQELCNRPVCLYRAEKDVTLQTPVSCSSTTFMRWFMDQQHQRLKSTHWPPQKKTKKTQFCDSIITAGSRKAQNKIENVDLAVGWNYYHPAVAVVSPRLLYVPTEPLRVRHHQLGRPAAECSNAVILHPPKITSPGKW